MHFKIAEHRAVEVAEFLVVVARHVDHASAVLGLAKDSAQHVVVKLRPEETAPQAPHVDDVADQVELIHVHTVQEVEHQFGAALARAKMDVRQEGGAYLELGAMRWGHMLLTPPG